MNAYKKWIGRLPLVGDMLFSLLTIQACLKFIYEGYDPQPELLDVGALTAMLLCIGFSRLFRAFRLRR